MPESLKIGVWYPDYSFSKEGFSKTKSSKKENKPWNSVESITIVNLIEFSFKRDERNAVKFISLSEKSQGSNRETERGPSFGLGEAQKRPSSRNGSAKMISFDHPLFATFF